MKPILAWAVAVWLVMLAGCGAPGGTPPPGATATSTRDGRCSAENISTTIDGVNALMREFDDAAGQAANLPVPELPKTISNLQRIRRDTEDWEIPPCLADLKRYQLNYMNAMIQTLIGFVGGSDQISLVNGLALARQDHNRYDIEIARLLGITLEPLTATPPPKAETPVPSRTP